MEDTVVYIFNLITLFILDSHLDCCACESVCHVDDE